MLLILADMTSTYGKSVKRIIKIPFPKKTLSTVAVDITADPVYGIGRKPTRRSQAANRRQEPGMFIPM
jgi:hypothetical protein